MVYEEFVSQLDDSKFVVVYLMSCLDDGRDKTVKRLILSEGYLNRARMFYCFRYLYFLYILRSRRCQNDRLGLVRHTL